MALNFSRRQWLTLIVIGIADFCNAICVSLQAPFYPQEAEKKGATATEYGLVFGVFELVVFIISPVYGKYLNRIGPKVLFNAGIFTTGTCAILFGFLERIDDHIPFIALSFIIRIVEALGNAAFLTASFAIIAREFPDNVATTFLIRRHSFFGLGLIVGPTLGGALYSVGGYTTPFAVLGSALFLAAVMTALVLPKQTSESDVTDQGSSMVSLLRIPAVIVCALSIAATSVSIGFLSATLEPHLRQFELSPIVLGMMFIVNGGTYALTAPVWGWLCDRGLRPKTASLAGCILVASGFSLVGPLPFLPYTSSLTTIIIGLVIHGLGISAQLVASFTDALNTSVARGLPNNIETYGLVSGLWTSTFALGAFVGPSVSGALFDSIGFRNSTLFVIGLHGFVAITLIVFLCLERKQGPYKEIPPSACRSTTSLLLNESGSTRR
ncbi:MFS-type transporter SLC18B1-like [Ctenocephalides felis]|uniref:MFS-type transporter SLC18B1-like n=1 Tax=Ctenocephalides felis TaxID=7515 RepID=UPI000E6E5962|nr:MFS-type transporter SLC18B1-like [Ctenocephalides felis]